jgi:hypothetical protein
LFDLSIASKCIIAHPFEVCSVFRSAAKEVKAIGALAALLHAQNEALESGRKLIMITGTMMPSAAMITSSPSGLNRGDCAPSTKHANNVKNLLFIWSSQTQEIWARGADFPVMSLQGVEMHLGEKDGG